MCEWGANRIDKMQGRYVYFTLVSLACFKRIYKEVWTRHKFPCQKLDDGVLDVKQDAPVLRLMQDECVSTTLQEHQTHRPFVLSFLDMSKRSYRACRFSVGGRY